MIEILEIITICLVPLAMGWWPCDACAVSGACANCTAVSQYIKVGVGDGTGIGAATVGTDLEVGGNSLADSGCDSCQSIPGTYVIENELFATSTDACDNVHETCTCDAGPSVRVLFDKVGSDFITQVTISDGSGGSGIYKKNHSTTKPDCSAFSNTDIPYDSDSGTSCTGWSSLKVSLTSFMSGAEDSKVQCGNCFRGSGPDTLIMRMSGTPADNTCTDCDELENRDITMTRGTALSTCCTWTGTYVGSDCTYNFVLTIDDGGYTIIHDTIGASWNSAALNGPHNCSNATTLSFSSNGLQTECNFTGTSIEVRAA